MKFHADKVECWSQNQVETVFFGNPEKELALLMSNVPGTTDHYLEWNDQSNAYVNAVQKIQVSGEELYLQLSPEAAERLGETAFTVDFDCDDEVFEAVTRGLALIFHDKFLLQRKDIKKKASPKQDYGKIKYLNLEGKNLKKLPEYVSEMALLETAKLGFNPQLDFHATCEVLARLPNVKHLTYTTDGSIPENLGKLTQLETLTIDGLTKPCALPESIGQLKKLKYLLIMSDSDFVLPESFAELRAIEDLNIRAEGWQLPSKFYQLSKLKQLDFTNCRFTTVPPEMAQMTEVGTVIFGSPETRDYAQILPIVAQMPNLRTLEMNVNPVPKEIGLCKNIEELIIWTGVGSETPLQLPDELFGLTQLHTLLLSMNYFEKIPDAIGNLKNLKKLVFVESNFESLPNSVGELSNLEFLNISENPSLKTLPESLGKLTQLKELYLNDNPQLTALPECLKNLTNLTSVRLSNRDTIKHVPENWNHLFTEA